MHHDGEFVVELDVHLMADMKQREEEGELGSQHLPQGCAQTVQDFQVSHCLKALVISQQCHGLATKPLTDGPLGDTYLSHGNTTF